MAKGTGLPLPQSDATLQPGGLTDKPNAYSNADSWAQVAQTGAQLHARGVSMIEREAHEAQTGYLAGAELDVDRDYLNMVDQHSKDGPDPQGFDKAWTAYTEGRLSKAEPWAVNHLRKLLKNKGNSGYGQLLNQRRGQDRALNAKKISSLAELAGNDVITSAMSGSLGTDEGKARLAKYKSTLDAGVTANLIPQEEADQRFADVTSRATAETIIKSIGDTYEANLGKGDALKAALDDAENLLLRSDNPALRGLDEQQRYSYYNKATAAIRAQDAERRIGLTQLKGQIADVTAAAKEGILPPPETMGALRQAVGSAADPELALDLQNADLMAETYQAASKTPLPELQSFVAAERQRLQAGGGTRAEVDRLTATESVLTAAEAGLKKDPVAWAEKAAFAPRTELDFSNGTALAASLKARVPVAEISAAHYQVSPVYLKEAEKRVMIARAQAGGDQMLDMLRGVAATGVKAPAILADIFPDAPATAMLGGLIAEVGDVPVARDAADAIKLKLDLGDKFKSLGGTQEETRTAAVAVLGEALSEMPKSEGAIIALANAAYEVRARRAGKTGGDFDSVLYTQILKEVLGERTVNGETYGGVVRQKDGWFSDTGAIIIPPSIKQDSFNEVLDSVTPGDLDRAGLKRPVGEGGKALPMSLIRSGTLVPVGSGRFAVALGNPAEPGAERWLMSDPQNDEKFILDMNAVAPLINKRRPDLFFGG
jgi:hypothetical protein